MPRRHRLRCLLAVSVLLLAGCTDPVEPSARSTPAPTGSGRATVPGEPLVRGLDVCTLATPDQVRSAVGQVGEPTVRSLTVVEGYAGLVDQCGFGVSFHSSTFQVAVGLAPATRKDVDGLGGRPVRGLGDAARLAVRGPSVVVSFLKGGTLVRVQAAKSDDGVSRVGRVTAVARQIAGAVPPDPPGTDAQTDGVCSQVDPRAVQGVLGAPAGVSRTLVYKDQSAVCSWATGARDPRTVSVSLYTNRQAGTFFADQKTYLTSLPVPGVTGDAFTVPGIAYVVVEDGQVVSVRGTFPPRVAPDQPLRVTPQLAALMSSAAALLR